ncbi:MAG: NnrS family protein [Gammaproteobacteria bacterium]|nr:NnrS family protein [Gammaproteobacteria bacterium]
MAVIPLGEKPPLHRPIKGLTPFALGFRPFFSVAVLSAVILLSLWLAAWSGWIATPSYYGMIGWHSHEMLFGYTSAVIAGFLLTAVRNWTGIDTLKGTPLALLTLTWLLGRVMPYLHIVPAPMIALLDLSFLPLLALALYRPLILGKNKINRIFLPLIAVMSLANLLVHLEALGLVGLAEQGMDLMLNMILVLLTLVSGRVLPFFTEKAVVGAKPRFNKLRERLVFSLIIGWTLVQLVYPQPLALVLLALGVAVTQTWRLFDWYHPKIWRIPILWVLFTGLGWLIIGFILQALAMLGRFADSLAIHALTGGAIGVLTMGMMARVALGHTGRALKTFLLVEISFIGLNIAIVLRVFTPALVPEFHNLWIQLSGSLWILCFTLFSFAYLPILLKPRIDGRPG